MIKYADIDPRKKAFVLELDNVLYPEKDYLYQVYYLFASMIEYTELFDAQTMISLMTKTYQEKGNAGVLEKLVQRFKINEKYRANFEQLMVTANLPLKLLLYERMLKLLQEIVIDRKKIFIVTDGNPQLQLNKIRQTEWHGLEKYLICYFTEESAPKPEPDIIHLLLKEHNLQRRDLLMIENSAADVLCAEAAGIDHFNVSQFL